MTHYTTFHQTSLELCVFINVLHDKPIYSISFKYMRPESFLAVSIILYVSSSWATTFSTSCSWCF